MHIRIVFLLLIFVLSAGKSWAADPLDFSLTMDGKSWSLSDHRGKVTLLVFGYTFCPDICPTSLSIVAAAIDRLSDQQREKVQGVFISVDPGRDRPEILRDYASNFGPKIEAVTGSKAEIDQACDVMGVDYFINKKEGAKNGEDEFYSVDHSPLTFLLNKKGQQVAAFAGHHVPPEALADYLHGALSKSD